MPPDVAITDGYAVSFRVGATLLVLAGVLSLLLLERVATEARTPGV